MGKKITCGSLFLPADRELGIHSHDIIAGDILIVGLTEDDFGSLPLELMEKYERFFCWTEWILSNGEEILMISDEE